MAIEKLFVKEGIRDSQLEEYLGDMFDKAGYSHTEMQRTPMGTRIIIFAHRPGLIIGKSGRRIQELTEAIKVRFGIENPLLDVKEVDEPLLDPAIVAKRIARSLEKGINFKKVCNFYLEEVTKGGAIGITIRVAGKLAGVERSRFAKFRRGFVAHSGEYAETLVRNGFTRAAMKPGMVGIQVKIMMESPKEITVKQKVPSVEDIVAGA
ncbi:MAG: 30S ribosomal protein S3 [Candidatus Aenigmarchaeota archaeon]|nr:30S ribosomal protein S3 [Candidatus Aenigmarchaeota archaeon]